MLYDADLNEINVAAREALLRGSYRERFSLTSEQMDAEPYDEFMLNQQIWALQERRRKHDERRNEQSNNGV